MSTTQEELSNEWYKKCPSGICDMDKDECDHDFDMMRGVNRNLVIYRYQTNDEDYIVTVYKNDDCHKYDKYECSCNVKACKHMLGVWTYRAYQ